MSYESASFKYVLVVAVLFGSLFAVKSQAQDQDVVRAKKFVIENPDGSKEMSIRANKSGAGVVLADKRGDAVVGIVSDQRESAFILKQINGAQIQLGTAGEQSAIRFFDQSKNLRLQVQNTKSGSRIQMLDEEGNVKKEFQYSDGQTKQETDEDESKDKTTSSDTTNAPEPELTVGARKLYEEFNKNLIKAEKKYLDKWVVLTGNVKSVNKDATGYFVKLKTDDGYFSHKCYFPESRSQELADLSGDQYVQILGKVTSGDDTGAILKRCRIKQGAKGDEIPDSFLQSRIFVRWGIADFDEGFTPDRLRKNYEKSSTDLTTKWKRVGQKRYMLQVYDPEEDKTTELYFKHRDDHSRITKVHLKGVEGKDLYTDWQKISRYIKLAGLNKTPDTDEE